MGLDEDDIDYEAPSASAQKRRQWFEFDCPDCTANNPFDDGFRAGDEVTCLHCGTTFVVRSPDGERFVLKHP